jgi:hypothetical protein
MQGWAERGSGVWKLHATPLFVKINITLFESGSFLKTINKS